MDCLCRNVRVCHERMYAFFVLITQLIVNTFFALGIACFLAPYHKKTNVQGFCYRRHVFVAMSRLVGVRRKDGVLVLALILDQETPPNQVMLRLSDGSEVMVEAHEIQVQGELRVVANLPFCIDLGHLHDFRLTKPIFEIRNVPGKGEGVLFTNTHLGSAIATGIPSISAKQADAIIRKESGRQNPDPVVGERRSTRSRQKWNGMYVGGKAGLIVESARSGGRKGRRRRNYYIGNKWPYYINAPSDGKMATHKFTEARIGRTWYLFIVPLCQVMYKGAEMTIDYEWKNVVLE